MLVKPRDEFNKGSRNAIESADFFKIVYPHRHGALLPLRVFILRSGLVGQSAKRIKAPKVGIHAGFFGLLKRKINRDAAVAAKLRIITVDAIVRERAKSPAEKKFTVRDGVMSPSSGPSYDADVSSTSNGRPILVV